MNNPIVLFDGTCKLCNGAVQYLLRLDRKRLLRYSPLQGDTAREVLERHPAMKKVDSVLYVRHYRTASESVLAKSDAAMAIGEDLGGLHRLGILGKLLPRFLRDGLYDLVAKHRFTWFGRLPSCSIPSAETQGLFLK